MAQKEIPDPIFPPDFTDIEKEEFFKRRPMVRFMIFWPGPEQDNEVIKEILEERAEKTTFVAPAIPSQREEIHKEVARLLNESFNSRKIDYDQARRILVNPGILQDWFSKLTDPQFDPEQFEKGALTPTKYGAEIRSPFNGMELIADGPGDEKLIAGIDHIKLTNILTDSDGERISFEEACNRGGANPETNWGQRAAFALCDVGNAGKISFKVWPVSKYVVCPKTRWRGPQDGDVYAWYVIRNGGGFSCSYGWFDDSVGRNGQFASLGK